MSDILITEIDENNFVEVEMSNRHELEMVANAILPIIKTVGQDEHIALQMRVQVYERIDLCDLPKDIFNKVCQAIFKVCQDQKASLGQYTQELTTKLKADPRFT